MKRIFISLSLILTALIAAADAQFYKSEATRKAAEKMMHGDRAGAIAILDKAIEQHKDLNEVYQMRADLRSMTGDLDGAIADYTSALEISPGNPKLYERRASFRMFRRDSAGALKDYDAAIANGLKTENVFTGRASIKRDMGDIEGAIADYQAALVINPNLAAAHNGLAFTLETKGDVDGAIAHLQEFLDRYEGKHEGKMPSMKGELTTGDNILIKREGKEKDGGQVYLTGGEVTGTFSASSPEEMEKQEAKINQTMNLGLSYANLGQLYAKKNDFDRALENYEKGLKVRKNDSYIHKLRSQIRIKKGDLQGAIEDLTIVANSRQGAPDRHADKGLLLILQGQDAEAEKEFALHLQMFPNSQEFLNKKIEEAKKLRSQQPQP
jgi:tetratricopeptide (TPR) repeat protein